MPAVQVIVLFESGSSTEVTHILQKLMESCARCIRPRMPSSHESRARFRVLLYSLSAPNAHDLVSLLVRLCVTLLGSGSVLGRIGRVPGTYYCVVEARERDSKASVYHFRD